MVRQLLPFVAALVMCGLVIGLQHHFQLGAPGPHASGATALSAEDLLAILLGLAAAVHACIVLHEYFRVPGTSRRAQTLRFMFAGLFSLWIAVSIMETTPVWIEDGYPRQIGTVIG